MREIQFLGALIADVAPGPSRFVGRNADVRYMVERLAQAEGGQGQIVSLVGEPGIGKSRLLHELHREVAGRVTWLEGQAVSHGCVRLSNDHVIQAYNMIPKGALVLITED